MYASVTVDIPVHKTDVGNEGVCMRRLTVLISGHVWSRAYSNAAGTFSNNDLPSILRWIAEKVEPISYPPAQTYDNFLDISG